MGTGVEPALSQDPDRPTVRRRSGPRRPYARESSTQLALRTASLFETQACDVTEIFWQFDRPFLIEASAIETHIGQLTLTPHADAVAQTMAAHRREAENHRHAG